MPVIVLEHDSKALRNNPLKDPHVRELFVIVPDDYDASEPLPCIWYLSGYGGVGNAMLSHDPWQEGLEHRVKRLRKEGQLGKMLIALPDAFTKYGGSQYLSSPAIGDYETYLYQELPHLLESRFLISRHGIVGKSSGGFGALRAVMRPDNFFVAAACHSGDMGFELSLFSHLSSLMNAVRDHSTVEGLVAAFERAKKKKDGKWFEPISILALASVYSPDEHEPLGIALPFSIETGRIKHDVWNRWLKHDPVELVEDPQVQTALRRLKMLYLDCGRRDEHALHWGAKAMHQRMVELGIAHVYEDFDDGHRNTSYRFDVSLPLIYKALIT